MHSQLILLKGDTIQKRNAYTAPKSVYKRFSFELYRPSMVWVSCAFVPDRDWFCETVAGGFGPRLGWWGIERVEVQSVIGIEIMRREQDLVIFLVVKNKN